MEIWDILDESGKRTGRTMTRGERLLSGQYHLVVHIWIVNSAGHLLIQKRAEELKLMPGIWAITSGSAVTGEDSLSAARRELKEELGIDAAPDALRAIGRLRRRNSHCDLWLLRRDIKVECLLLQREEVAEARWVSLEQLRAMVGHRLFHNYGYGYFNKMTQCVRELAAAPAGGQMSQSF